MKVIYSVLVPFFCFLSLPSFGQIKIHSGIETGVSFSQFPFHDNADNVLLAGKYYTNKESDLPAFGALIGVAAQTELSGNWVCDVAFQYQMSGRKLIENAFVNENTTGGNSAATDDFTETQTFHKLAVPVAVGYNLDLGKRKLGFFLGLRANWLVSGKYSMTHTKTELGVSKLNQSVDVNSFDVNVFSPVPKRNVNQIFAAISFRMSEHLELSTRFNISPNNIEYTLKDATLCNGDCVKKMRSDDFQFVIRYYLKN
jgi:hypothetical protein